MILWWPCVELFDWSSKKKIWRGCSLSIIQTSRVLQEVTSRWPVSSGQGIWLRKAEVDPSLLVSGLNSHQQNKMAAISLSSHCARSLCIFSSQKLRCFCTQGDSRTTHVPVMLKECLSFLAPRDGQVGRTFYPSFVYQSLRVAVFFSSNCIELLIFQLYLKVLNKTVLWN